VRITESEWKRLKSERDKILQQLDAVQEVRRKAFAKEQRLYKQLDLLDRRGGEAVAVADREAAQSDELDASDIFAEEFLADIPPPPDESGLALTPGTWSAMGGLSDDFWSGGNPAEPVGNS